MYGIDTLECKSWSELHFFALGQKQRAEQFFRISGRALAAVAAIYTADREKLFPWLMEPIAAKRHFVRICKLAAVPVGGHSAVFHRCRCTAITHAWFSIGPDYARQLAGHPSIETTYAHYVDPRIAIAYGSQTRCLF